jgi:hypothetical protein
VKTLLPIFLFLALAAAAALRAEDKPKTHYTIYAEFLQQTPVDLTTGAKWMMDKGDCFPVYMFKEHQTRVVLQLASATFTTDVIRVRILKDSENARALQSYHKNLDAFFKTQTDSWKKDAESRKAGAGGPATP